MNLRMVALIIFLSALSFPTDAQENVNSRKMVGFGCYFEGRPTKVVTKVSKLLNEKDYTEVAKLLGSSNEGECYLAVISVQRLSDLGLYQLSDLDATLIEKAKQSEKLVSVCSGCTYFDKVALKVILSQENFIGSRYWLDKNIKPN